MKIFFFLILILCSVTLYTFKSFESGLLNNGFSWTMSKLLPYLTLAIGGILLAYSFAKGFKIRVKIVKVIVAILLIAAPFGVGFILHPIYQGDFSSEGTEVAASTVKVDEKYDLVIVTIPGCPYCLASIEQLKKIKERTPEANLLFSVCSSNKKDLEVYKLLIAGKFDIALAEDIEASVKLAEGHFPTFVQVKKGIPVYKWSNDQFGAGAMDQFEGEVK